jgi:predicted NUDIX family NTP pyrophosphohydrolase
VEVFLIHPGGPFWAKKDAGAWSIPKGSIEPGEDAQAAARREFAEETGFTEKTGFEFAGDLVSLGSARQPSGKTIHAWATEAALDPEAINSNTFEVEWPPRSGRKREFPEADRAAWFTLAAARDKILPGQAVFLERLAVLLGGPAFQDALGGIT